MEETNIDPTEQAFLNAMAGEEIKLGDDTSPKSEEKKEVQPTKVQETKTETPKIEESQTEPAEDDLVMLVDEPIKNIESEDYPDDFNKVVAQRFSDYGVTDGKQLEELLTSKSGEYESRIAELEAQLKEVSTKGLAFENEAQKKLYEFAKQFDGTNAKLLAEYEYLQNLDVSKMDDKAVLKEAFVQANKSFGREKAEEMFEYEYEDNYDTENLDPDYDNKEIRKRSLKLERDAANAKKQLVETISNFKVEPNSKPQSQEEAKMMQEVERVVAKAASELPNINKIEIPLDKSGNQKFAIGLTSEQKSFVIEQTKNFLSNPSNYDADGKLKHGATPQSVFEFITESTYKPLIYQKIFERGMHVREMQGVEKRAVKAQKPISAGSLANELPKNDEEAFLKFLAQS